MTQFTITELSNNKYYKSAKPSYPQISGKNVVWRIANPNENKIVLYDGDKTIEIVSANGSYPRMSEDNMVWNGSDSEGDIEIFFYNGKETIQVTNNDANEINPQISGDNVAWVTDATRDMNIYFYNGQGVIHLNEGNLANEFPQISGDNVAWSSKDSSGNRQIFLYNGKETRQLSSKKHQYVSSFQVSGDNVVWSGKDFSGNRQIFFYNGKETIGLSGNNNAKNFSSPLEGKKIIENSKSSPGNKMFLDNNKQTFQLSSVINPILFDALNYYEPYISGDNVVWKSERGVFLYNGKKTIKLDNNVNLASLQIQGHNLVWNTTIDFFDSKDDSEIFLYNGKETIQLTDNDLNDFSPEISGDNIVWDSGNDFNSEIFLYDGKEIIQLTDNNVNDMFPKIDGNRIVWQRIDETKAEPTTSVMLATLDDTKSSSIPPLDREQELVSSSVIIIFGLISCHLLKKLYLK